MSIGHITIRRAVRADCARLLELIRELAVYERAPDEVTVSLTHFEESGFGKDPVWWAFVAETADPSDASKRWIAGFALYYIRYSTWKGQCMYLEDLLVTEPMRREGIGALLFERLVKEARERGWKRIVWQVLEWNDPAIGFYRKIGAKLDPEWVNGILDL